MDGTLRRIGILLVGLLFWVEPTSAQEVRSSNAQKVYSLTVSIHEGLHLTEQSTEEILDRASNLLQRNGCNVTFKFKGPVQTFTAQPITDASTLDVVHQVPADIKVVPRINFCAAGFKPEGYLGCAWRPEDRPRTVIVTPPALGVGRDPMLWAHEFGHTTGLPHRNDEHNQALMTPCPIEPFNWKIDEVECGHFLAGPAQSYPGDPGLACPRNSLP
jgi:hypothetical protein